MVSEVVLVVGGAGYIGSHTCLALAERGYSPVTFDSFANGHREFVQWGPTIQGDIREFDQIYEAICEVKPAAIVHFAGLIEVAQSIAAPSSFYHSNVVGTLNVLRAAQKAGVGSFVFSSTCATYGVPEHMPITEDTPQHPINPYGRTKLVSEMAIQDACGYEGMRAVILRYFNAAGADFSGRIGEWHEPETHIIPLTIDVALGRREELSIFGRDYDTRDGTCVRDYVHVLDLADAHVRAVDHLIGGGDSEAINLGTGNGTSVLELAATVESVSGRKLRCREAGRRDGDPPTLVADNSRADRVLGWKPRYGIEDIVGSAYEWHMARNH
jgi:UDP-glucose 4-epimerase